MKELILLSIALPVASIHAIISARKIGGGSGGEGSLVRQVWQRCFAKATKEDGLICKMVAKELQERIEVQAKQASHVLGMATTALVVLACSTTDMTDARQFIAIAAGIALSIVLLLMRVFPAWVKGRMLDVWFALIWSCLLVALIFQDRSNPMFALRALAFSGFLRLLFTWIFARLWSGILLNLLWSIVEFLILYELNSLFPFQGVGAILLAEMTNLSFMISCTILARTSLEREIFNHVQLKSLSVESSAMTKMLNLVCDVVVEMDSGLQLIEHSPGFAAMLVTDRNTRGLKLQQYFTRDSEREHFAETLANSSISTNSCSTGALHAALRDSMNNSINVEIFYVVFAGLDGSRRYFIGIREFADQPVAELRQNVSDSERGIGRPKLAEIPFRGTPHVVSNCSFQEEAAGNEQDGHAIDGRSSAIIPSNTDNVVSAVPLITSRGNGRLVDERFKHTTTSAMRWLVVQIMLQCNARMSKRSCCPFHATLHEINQCLKFFHRGCDKSFKPKGNAQCRNCGVVAEWLDDTTCEICLSDSVEKLGGVQL